MPFSHLNKKQHRITKQRRIILEELRKVKTHPTALELFELVKKRMPEIGLATVYRNLDFLEKNQFIIKLQTKDREARYDGKTDIHCHLVCLRCGDVMDIEDCKKIDIQSDTLKTSGFKPTLDYLEIPGFCKKCY